MKSKPAHELAVGAFLIAAGIIATVVTYDARAESDGYMLVFGPVFGGLALVVHGLSRLTRDPNRMLATGASYMLPAVSGLALLAVWWAASAFGMFPIGTVPAPDEVGTAFRAELASGRLLDDTIASLYRVGWGFITAVLVAVPLGLVIGRHAATRAVGTAP